MKVEALEVNEFVNSLNLEVPAPVGTVVVNNLSINSVMDSLKLKWDEFKKVAKENGTFSSQSAVKFLFLSLDALILVVEKLIPGEKGSDKKATVLLAISGLYDYVIKQFMPVWLKPFSGYIKNFFVTVVCSIAIDWIVSKYNKGTWSLS